MYLFFQVVDSRVEEQTKAFNEGKAAVMARVQLLKERQQQ
jgi:hypothetical protein